MLSTIGTAETPPDVAKVQAVAPEVGATALMPPVLPKAAPPLGSRHGVMTVCLFTPAIFAPMGSVTSKTCTPVAALTLCRCVSELKKNPMGTVAAGEGFAVAILNRNEPAFYCVPAKAYEAMLDRLEDLELNAIADAREGQPIHRVTLDDL